jgi:peptidylprolyl isomerase
VLSRVLALALLASMLGCAPASTGGEPADGDPAPAADLGAKPDLLPILPDDRGEAPAELVVDDLVVGGGEAASPGDQLTVHYVGAEWSSGAEFDASWDRGQPLVFELGAGRVIEGWEQGLVGMREGGRRVLVIPAELAYADRGVGDVIGPGATLVFVIDLLDVQAPG